MSVSFCRWREHASGNAEVRDGERRHRRADAERDPEAQVLDEPAGHQRAGADSRIECRDDGAERRSPPPIVNALQDVGGEDRVRRAVAGSEGGGRGDVPDSRRAELQQQEPDDYVIATGETHSVREFAEKAFARLDIPLQWQGSGVHEKGIDAKTGKVILEIDAKYFRPTEVDLLLGDPTKAKQKLGWEPKVTFEGLVNMMVDADLKAAEREQRADG